MAVLRPHCVGARHDERSARMNQSLDFGIAASRGESCAPALCREDAT
jgi:hypothetical protein